MTRKHACEASAPGRPSGRGEAAREGGRDPASRGEALAGFAGRGGAARPDTTTRGRAAEEAAAAWLVAQGFEVLARNHTTRRGEVDLVCREAGVVCFVEVRSRARLDYGSPAASVDVRKARRVVAAATDWALRHGGLEQDMRFDVVSVDLSPGAPRLELFRGAFDATGHPR